MRGLSGKVALVVGAATGIGAQTASRLAEEGARVACADLEVEKVAAVADGVRSRGGDAAHFSVDVGDPGSVARLAEDVQAAFGPVQLLHNSAAAVGAHRLPTDADVVTIELDIWERALRVNTRGTLLVCRAVIPQMLASGGGAIVNMSSIAAFIGEDVRVAYSSSKAAVGAITRHIATRWGKQNIRCNAVAPGVVLTDAIRRAADDERLARILDATPFWRSGLPVDAAGTVAFLLSEDAMFVNGQILILDGGKSVASRIN